MKKFAAIVFCGLFFIALAGCEKSGTGTSEETNVGANEETDAQQAGTAAAKNYDPCVLVTQAEAETVLGGPVTIKTHQTVPPSNNPLGQKICFYDGDTKGYVQLSINEQALFATQNGETVEQLYNDSKAGLGDAVVVTGVGDESFYSPTATGAGLYTLVKDKGVMFMTSVFIPGAALSTRIDNDKQLVTTAISRL